MVNNQGSIHSFWASMCQSKVLRFLCPASIYVTRINSNCCYTHNHISRKVPMSTRCIRDLSRGGWRVLQLTYFVCEQSNLTLQLQHLSVRVIATRSVRCTVFWRRRNSARRSNRTASWGESGRRIFVRIQIH